jgi:hypothetical protein
MPIVGEPKLADLTACHSNAVEREVDALGSSLAAMGG